MQPSCIACFYLPTPFLTLNISPTYYQYSSQKPLPTSHHLSHPALFPLSCHPLHPPSSSPNQHPPLTSGIYSTQLPSSNPSFLAPRTLSCHVRFHTHPASLTLSIPHPATILTPNCPTILICFAYISYLGFLMEAIP